MFELLLETGSISNEGTILAINDKSDWTLAPLGGRTSYGVILDGEFRLSATGITAVATDPNEPLTDATWNAATPTDGRYTFSAYAFLTVAAYAGGMISGDLAIDVDNLLKMYNGATWDVVELADHKGEEAYLCVLEVPYLAHAYTYKNLLNLDYIKQVKGDIAKGAEQNKLYYKRTDLDYFRALLDGACYNWSLGLYYNFYEIVINLDDIRLNQQIS